MQIAVALHYTVWVSTILLQAAGCILLLSRNLRWKYTAFFFYSAFEVLREVLLAIALRLYCVQAINYSSYFYSYWGSDLISIILSLVVVRAVIRNVSREHEFFRRFADIAFRLLLVVLLLAAIVTVATSQGTSSGRIIATVLLLDRCIRLIQIGLIFVLTLFAVFLGLHWKSDLSFGISLGFGIFASLDLASVTLRAQFGPVADSIYAFIRAHGYALAVLTWFLYIRVAQKKLSAKLPNADLADLEKWNDALTEMMGQ